MNEKTIVVYLYKLPVVAVLVTQDKYKNKINFRFVDVNYITGKTSYLLKYEKILATLPICWKIKSVYYECPQLFEKLKFLGYECEGLPHLDWANHIKTHISKKYNVDPLDVVVEIQDDFYLSDLEIEDRYLEDDIKKIL